MSVPFSTDGADVISRGLDLPSVPKCSSGDLTDVYELDRCADWIKTNALKRVALQFPDALLVDSAAVAEYLQKHTSSLVFILADTSYGSCCVDEVAAEHYKADSLIHFGHSCLSPTRRLPVLYVFGRQPLDVTDCCSLAAEAIKKPLILIYDVRFHHYRDELEATFSKHFPSVIIASLAIPGQSHQESESSQSAGDSSEQTIINQFGRKIILPQGTSLSDYAVCYIGEEGMAMTNWILHLASDSFFSYSPSKKTLQKDTMNVNRFLMKRFHYIERAKDAQIVGLLVGTLGVADYIDVLDRMRKLAKDAGKKTYTFVVGKINVPKLANFLEIDIYVLVACPENSLLDSSEFYRPVITPFELEMACNQARDWSGKLVTDFRRLLPGGADYVAEPDNPIFEGDVSLVTGRVRCMGVQEEDKVIGQGQGQLATQQTSLVAGSTAGFVLADRSWQGLEAKLGQTPVEKAKEGRRGIAMGYTDEPNQES